MADQVRDEKLAILNGLAGNYAATLSPETAKMWLFLLKNYSVQQTQAAALSVIRKHGTESVPYKTMPPFALMQKELDAMTGTVRGEEGLKLKARAEWGKLLAMIEDYGSYREPAMNRTTAYCVRSFGGWAQVCRWKMEELTFRERDFIQLWEQSHDKEEFLTLGCEGVKMLEAPEGKRALSMEEFQDKKALLMQKFQQPQELPAPHEQEKRKEPFNVEALNPMVRAAREALIAAKAERMMAR